MVMFSLVNDLSMWLEERGIALIPQCIAGQKNIVADSLSRKVKGFQLNGPCMGTYAYDCGGYGGNPQ